MRDITIPTTIVTIMMVKTPAWIKKAIESIGSTEAVRKIPISPIPINAFPILRIFQLLFNKICNLRDFSGLLINRITLRNRVYSNLITKSLRFVPSFESMYNLHIAPQRVPIIARSPRTGRPEQFNQASVIFRYILCLMFDYVYIWCDVHHARLGQTLELSQFVRNFLLG